MLFKSGLNADDDDADGLSGFERKLQNTMNSSKNVRHY